MKKWFGHTKKTVSNREKHWEYDESEYDWDEIGEEELPSDVNGYTEQNVGEEVCYEAEDAEEPEEGIYCEAEDAEELEEEGIYYEAEDAEEPEEEGIYCEAEDAEEPEEEGIYCEAEDAEEPEEEGIYYEAEYGEGIEDEEDQYEEGYTAEEEYWETEENIEEIVENTGMGRCEPGEFAEKLNGKIGYYEAGGDTEGIIDNGGIGCYEAGGYVKESDGDGYNATDVENGYYEAEGYAGEAEAEAGYYEEEEYVGEIGTEAGYYEAEGCAGEAEAEAGYYEEEEYVGEIGTEDDYYEAEGYAGEAGAEDDYYEAEGYAGEAGAEDGYYEAEGYAGEAGTEAGYYETEEHTGQIEAGRHGFGAAGRFSKIERKLSRPEQEQAPRKRGNGGFLPWLGNLFGGMEAMDWVMLVAGVGVLVLAIFAVGMFFNARSAKQQVSEFTTVGTQLDGISVIGGKGLSAVEKAEADKLVSTVEPEPQPTEEPRKDYDEKEYDREVSVEPEFTSVQKDLKIKFINSKTNKLVANVPFAVSIVDPDGATYIWSDDDMDGIIVKKDIKPGKYKVTLETLTDSKYSGYMLSTLTRTVEVKKEIDYKKVDVTNEVKTEKEVDVAKEDTKKNETVVESTLKDTVAWVESKVIEATYNEVLKSTIPDPATLAVGGGMLGGDVALADGGQIAQGPFQISESKKNFTLTSELEEIASEPVETVTPPAETPTPAETPAPPAETPTPPPAETPTPTETPAPPAETPTPPPAETPTPTETPAPPAETPTPTPVPTPPPAKGVLTVDNGTLSGIVGNTLRAKVTASGFTEGMKIAYTAVSGNQSVATASVDENGNVAVVGLAAGTAVITVTANYEGGNADTAATVSITAVLGGKKTMTLDKTSMTVFVGTQGGIINAEIANALSGDPVVTAVSSDTNVAVVSVDKKAVTVVGVMPGSANITVRYVENGEEVTAVCAVTVKVYPPEDKSTLLKNAEGEQLYVLDDNVYREAVYADYYSAEKFFVKGAARYTGWQTIGDKVYYFTVEGNAVTGEQVIQGAKYNFASDGSLIVGDGALGIDVSKWNGNINWNAVKNSGISYVIIRCGYRGSAQGLLIEDPKFEANIKGASAAGLKVGIYFFSQAVDEVEAVEEASMVLNQIKNYTISYPVFIDVEASGGRGDAIDKSARTAVCKAFCQTIQNSGYTAGIYSNKTWLEEKIDMGSLNAYKVWLAQYAAAPTYGGRYDLWQYRANGSVSGVSGDVDMNISYLGY